MGNYKTAILPILTVLAAAYTLIFKVEISHDTIDYFASVLAILIGAGINVYGIIKNHKKDGVKDGGTNENEE